MSGSRPSGSHSNGRWSQHPHDQDRQGREQRRNTARRLLANYLEAVAEALRADGLVVTDIRISPGPDLEAQLTLTSPAGGDSPPASPGRIELSWAEDTGWSISHHLLGPPATPWRYLHIELAPSPATVARFVVATLDYQPANAADDLDAEAYLEFEVGDVGMLYPAQFRFRGQPLHQVIDALAPHNNASGPSDAATARPRSAARATSAYTPTAHPR
ncbi:MAG: hypothetical protein J2P19_30705 [Pseudonocardia sp.]|nr:hypothetical protein [Pseudonocardia sp.]